MSGSSWVPAATDTISRWGHRLVTTDDGAPRTLLGSVDGAPRWLGGLAAGLQAAVLSLAVVVVPTVAAWVVTSADPINRDVGWMQSVGVGAGLWLLGHGVPLELDGVRVSLVPLGLTALQVFAAYASARRSGRPTPAGWAVGVSGYVAVTLLVALLSGTGEVGRAALGGLLVAAAGLGWGLLAQPGAPSLRVLTRPVWRRVPAPVRIGATAGVMAAAALVFVACGVVVGWTLAWRESIGDVVTNLGTDVIGWTTLAMTQLALVPDLVAWALAFIVGPGFVVGSGTHFTPAQIVSGPLPALPLFGGLPAPGSTNALTAWWPLVSVLVGTGAGWWLHRRLPRGRWWHPLVACGAAAVAAGLPAGVLVALASGSIGPGRMSEVGGSGVLVGGAVAVGTLIGSALVTLPRSSEVRLEASRRWQRVRPGGYVVVPDTTPTGEVLVDRVGSGTEDDLDAVDGERAEGSSPGAGAGDADHAGGGDVSARTGSDDPEPDAARAPDAGGTPAEQAPARG